jgi:mxaJ protein
MRRDLSRLRLLALGCAVLVARGITSCASGEPPAESHARIAPKNEARIDDAAPAADASDARVLRVCADPNNLPFSNDRLEGFENRVAEIVARDLHAELRYVWRAQRRGFFRSALKEHGADLVIGVPAGFDMALTTRPWYRSTYVFVARRDRHLDVRSLDDPRLRRLSVGVQLVGDDGADTPPAHALARRGIVDNVVGFTLYGDYRERDPPARIVDAVARGDVDVAAVWGPLAGWLAHREPVDLDLEPVEPQEDGVLHFAFSIAMGVPRDRPELRTEIDEVLVRRQTEIEAVLKEYGVPLLPLPPRTTVALH